MKKASLIVVFFVIVSGLVAQPIDNLRSRKKKAEEEIEFTNRLIEQAKKDERASLNKLRLIENKIYQRNSIITALSSESNVIQQLIDDNILVVDMMKEDLEALKNEYAKMVRFAYRNKNSYDNIIFLLSSNDFNQAYKRYLYLRQYTDYRKIQSNTLQALQGVLENKTTELQQQKDTKIKLLKEQEQEARLLSSEKTEQSSYVQKMQKEQGNLRQKLREQQKIEQELEREIQRIIEEEARKLREQGKPGFALTPEQKLVGANFIQNKSRLPWPVERGVITEHFGLHNHPSLKNIVIKNNGIDITTEPGSKARVIFNGEVSRVFAITGGNMAVIIRHGQYLSVYSNLKEVTVKSGDKVSIKQNIGTVFTDVNDGGKTILKFQLWFENQKMNPEEWLVK